MAFCELKSVAIFVFVHASFGFRWKDCAKKPLNAAFTFNKFKIWPVPATIPGDIHISAELTVNRRVNKLYIDEDVDETVLGTPFRLPCLGQGIGSCDDIDCCRYQDQNIPELWEKFMFYLLGNESVCPVQSKSVLIQDEIIHMPETPGLYESFSKKNFTVRLHFKEDPTTNDHIGCLEFDFQFISPQTNVTPAFLGRRYVEKKACVMARYPVSCTATQYHLDILQLLYRGTTGKKAWTDCVPEEFKDDIYVHSFVIEPLPIVLPGTYNVSLDAVINSDVDQVVIDVQVGVKNVTSGVIEQVYPMDRDYWRVFTGCLMIDKTLFQNLSLVQYDLDMQISKLMLEALTYLPGCPLLQGRIQFHQRPLVLEYDMIPLNLLKLGPYVVKVTYKSSTNAYLGCLQFHLNYGGQIIH